MIRPVAMSTTETVSSCSCVTMIARPSGETKASSGRRKPCPPARSPRRGNCQRIRPCGSTSSRRLLFSSAISTSPGSASGSDPGARWPRPLAGDRENKLGGCGRGVEVGVTGTVETAASAFLTGAGGSGWDDEHAEATIVSAAASATAAMAAPGRRAAITHLLLVSHACKFAFQIGRIFCMVRNFAHRACRRRVRADR